MTKINKGWLSSTNRDKFIVRKTVNPITKKYMFMTWSTPGNVSNNIINSTNNFN